MSLLDLHRAFWVLRFHRRPKTLFNSTWVHTASGRWQVRRLNPTNFIFLGERIYCFWNWRIKLKDCVCSCAGLEFVISQLKSILLSLGMVDRYLTVEQAVLLSRLEEEYQVGKVHLSSFYKILFCFSDFCVCFNNKTILIIQGNITIWWKNPVFENLWSLFWWVPAVFVVADWALGKRGMGSRLWHVWTQGADRRRSSLHSAFIWEFNRQTQNNAGLIIVCIYLKHTQKSSQPKQEIKGIFQCNTLRTNPTIRLSISGCSE